MSKKLVIFDCDGVLVDTEFVSSKVFAQALSNYGYSISVEECIRKFTGLHETVCRQMILQESGIHLPSDYWTLQQPSLLKALESELTALMRPVLEALNALKIPKCIASNSSKKDILKCLELTEQMDYFTDTSIFSSQQVLKAKPAPDVYLFAAHEMGFKPENCIVIEDSSVGAEAAIAAGMSVLLFTGGSHARSEWYRNQIATYNRPILSNCTDLLQAIQQKIESPA